MWVWKRGNYHIILFMVLSHFCITCHLTLRMIWGPDPWNLLFSCWTQVNIELSKPQNLLQTRREIWGCVSTVKKDLCQHNELFTKGGKHLHIWKKQWKMLIYHVKGLQLTSIIVHWHPINQSPFVDWSIKGIVHRWHWQYIHFAAYHKVHGGADGISWPMLSFRSLTDNARQHGEEKRLKTKNRTWMMDAWTMDENACAVHAAPGNVALQYKFKVVSW